MSKAVLVDLRRCIGCRACQVACKRWNNREAVKTEMNSDPKYEWTNPPNFSPDTYTYVKFVKTGSGDSLKWHFAKLQCNHCIEPHCVTACPTTALVKTEEGPVNYRKELCIGCAACVNACPFGVPKFDEVNKVIEKCTFCTERLAGGLETACVQACPTDALVLMDLTKAKKRALDAEASGLYTYGLHEVGGTSWIYISEVPFRELGFRENTNASPTDFQSDLLTKFLGTGVFIGGATLVAVKYYAKRRSEVASSERGE